MENQNKLKPCPLCGKPGAITIRDYLDIGTTKHTSAKIVTKQFIDIKRKDR